MPINRRDLMTLLKGKFGFEDDGFTDHQWLALWLGGRKRVKVKIPNPHSGRSGIPDPILGTIARNHCKVPFGFFKQMRDCTKGRDDYYQFLETTPYR